MKHVLKQAMARFIIRQKQKWDLNRIRPISPNIANLSQTVNEDRLRKLFRCTDNESEWSEDSQEISSFAIADTAGGVNVGDRRAIYYLLRYFRPKSVLEIGTHVGASTTYAIAALKRNRLIEADIVKLVTVDISDVNDPTTRPWIQWGSQYSARDMAQRLGAANWVTFVTRSSLDYFLTSTARYDFIFLDGDHSAKAVYREIPSALDHLNSNGVILLHDYFPSGRPLWKGKSPILGPWLAVQRFQSEGSQFKTLPLGELPWPTKLSSNITSLALLVQRGVSS